MSERSLTDQQQQVPTADSLIAQVDWGDEQQATGEDVPSEATPAQDDAPPADDAQPSGPSDEQKQLALNRGWVEKKDWKGRPGDWVDADAYIERSNHILPVVAKEAKKLREELRAEREERQRMQAEMAELRKHYQEQQEAAATIQVQTLLAQKAQAEQDGDFQTANRLGDQLLDLKLERKVALPKQPPQQRLDPQVQRTLEDFANDNPVFKATEYQTYLAVAAQQLAAAGTPLRGRELLEEAGDLAKQLFPKKFQAAQQQRRPAMAEMNGSPSRANGMQRGWGDLKPEVARQQEDFIRSTPQLAKQKDQKAVRASILADLPPSSFRR